MPHLEVMFMLDLGHLDSNQNHGMSWCPLALIVHYNIELGWASCVFPYKTFKQYLTKSKSLCA